MFLEKDEDKIHVSGSVSQLDGDWFLFNTKWAIFQCIRERTSYTSWRYFDHQILSNVTTDFSRTVRPLTPVDCQSLWWFQSWRQIIRLLWLQLGRRTDRYFWLDVYLCKERLKISNG